MELVELKEKTELSREDAAQRLHDIADELASGNDVRFERDGLKFIARVPDEVELKIEFELEDEGPSSRSSSSGDRNARPRTGRIRQVAAVRGSAVRPRGLGSTAGPAASGRPARRAETSDAVPELVPIRYERMLAIALHVLPRTPPGSWPPTWRTPRPRASRQQLCGDAHLANFGGFATPERDLVFDLNDFDETLPGPWEWDVKRLATSAGARRRASAASARPAQRRSSSATVAELPASRCAGSPR